MSINKLKTLHNPKSHAPAVYIPCWLIQVSVKLLSHGAKIVYGRLSQWSNEMGHAYRSANQLAEELGMCIRSVKRYQQELREVNLIGTYHPQAGGVNHFEFYDHPWMHEKINKNLIYKNDTRDPVHDHALPRAELCTTPVHDHARINNKEIKEIKEREDLNPKTTQTNELTKIKESNPFSVLLPDKYLIVQNILNKECLNDLKSQNLFKSKFDKLDITFEEMLYECVMFYALKPQAQNVSKQRFQNWIKRERIDMYEKKPDSVAHTLWKDFTDTERQLINDYNHSLKYPEFSRALSQIQKNKAKELIMLLKSTQNMRKI